MCKKLITFAVGYKFINHGPVHIPKKTCHLLVRWHVNVFNNG